MKNRRTFIKELSAMGALSVLPHVLTSKPKPIPKDDKIWGFLLHLGLNNAEIYVSSEVPPTEIRKYRPYLWLSDKLWNDALEKMADEGINMVVIDLANGVKYESHPEIAISGAWSTARLRAELDKIRKLGIEPIPKLNFSATHDGWLKKYSRMVSTKEYYNVCSDLIAEVSNLFDRPRFFHLGMDEEDAKHQQRFNYIVIRQNDLWWGDLYFLIAEVEKLGSRPWIWSDYVWNHPDTFYKKMPKSVLQSNWFYGANFDLKPSNESNPRLKLLDESRQTYIKGYIGLEAHGYDQVPTASNYGGGDWRHNKNGPKSLINTVKFCSSHISDSKLLGFLQASWYPTVEEYREPILNSIQLAGEAKKWFEKKE